MGRPQSNGLVELHDAKIDSKVFFCMDLVEFMFSDESTKDWEVWHEKFTQAKNGEVLIVTAAKGMNGRWQG